MERRIRPWMVAALLGVIGIAGAGSVWYAGTRIHASDRAAIVSWQRATDQARRTAAALLQSTDALGRRAFNGSAVGADAAAEAKAIQTALESARRQMLEARATTVVEVTAGGYLNAIAHNLAAVAAVSRARAAHDDQFFAREHDTFAAELNQARSLWRGSDDALAQLKDRFSIP